MADKESSGPIPDRWKLVVKKKKDGSNLSYYTCPESGQKFYSYEDLMRYVKYAKAAKLSIYADDFFPIKPARGRRSKKRASTPEPSADSNSDSGDVTYKLPPIDQFDWFEDEPSLGESAKQFAYGGASNEGCSSGMGDAKKQKKAGEDGAGEG
ncbi:putative Homeodomain-like protein [Hibiscus syriacus]|uniref:Homeodomain-like protein n=1 Tax=Hibiscus syriacus TaxID=106335 RepID=A0A6A3C9B9_HIBSY|nr:uncharacterized protein LOC120204451 [Hibiscus syriacus]KAE8724088.1 putative Homeodomain-like protein [Hibiscus syriacus]